MAVELDLVPAREKNANGAKLGRYDAVLPDGRVLARSRQPLFAAARTLLSEGFAPETAITARHAGSEIVAMRSTVGEAAQWTVKERDKGGLSKERWQPYDADSSSPVERNSDADSVSCIVSPDGDCASVLDRAA